MRLFERAARVITARPGLSLLVAGLGVGGLAAVAGAPPTDNSLEVWFVEDDPALARYRGFLEQFGNDEAIVIGYAPPRGLDAAELALLEAASERLRAVDGVSRVVSPASFGAATPATQALMRRTGVLGEDGAVGLLVFMEARADIDAARGRILGEVRAAVDSTLGAAGRAVHLAGTGVLYEGLNEQTERDSAVFLSLSLLVMCVLLWLGLGRVTAVLAVLAAPVLAALATTSLVALTGHSMNVVMATMPALLLVIGVADGIHIFIEWYRVRREAGALSESERAALVADLIARMAWPCLFTSVTTAIGFAALLSSRMAVIRDLGMFAAIGVMLAWVLVLVTCGATLALRDVLPPRRSLRLLLEERMARLAPLLTGRPRAVIGCFALAAAILVAGATRISVDTDTMGLLPEGHRVRRDSDWIERHVGLYTPLEFVIATPAGSALDPATRGRVTAWRAAAESRPEVQRTFSGLDLLQSGGLTAADAEAALARHRTATGDDLSAYLSAARDRVRVTALVPMGTARDFAGTVDALERSGSAILGDGSVTAAGYLPLYVRIIDYTVSSALYGLVIAFGAVFLVIGLLLRSGRLLLIAIPPNLFAIAAVFGFMGWAGIPLDIATATVGAIVLGIAVDDTIHYLHRYEELRRRGEADPVRGALREAGPAMVLTSAVLALGLAVLMGAGSLSVVYFGMTATIAVTAALAGDLLLLPALLARRGRA